MKGVVLLFVTFCVIVPLALSSRLLTASSSDVVVDNEGKEVKIGEPYYALSMDTMEPVWLGLCLNDLITAGSGCPHDVTQCTLSDQSQSLVGFPIIFSNSSSPANLRADSFVMEDTSYTINFPVKDNNPSCAGDTTWGLAQGSNVFTKIVTTDPATKAIEFQLSREGMGYKISYCMMSIPRSDVPICYALGFKQDGLYSRLVLRLGTTPAQFIFATNLSGVKKHATS